MILARLVILLSLLGMSFSLTAASEDHLVIISPHRKSIQDEFIPRFIAHYKDTYKKTVRVDWLDQGGTENEMRYIFSKYEKDPRASGVDIFWGGGDVTFIELENRGVLEAYTLPKHLADIIPQELAGIKLHSAKHFWYGTALSSFGLFFNRKLLKMQKLPEPKSWSDLARPEYFNQIIAANPRHSSTAILMSLIILEASGWKKGWELLFAFAGNTRNFTQSSSDPIKAVVAGDAAIAPAIDFYANSKISELGESNLGFTLPVGETLYNSDPIAILKGAPNRLVAERFVQFILGEEGQRIFILQKGVKGGPQNNVLARMGVNPLAYKNLDPTQKLAALNPYDQKGPQLKVSFEKLAHSKKIFEDLMGVIYIDNHSALKKAWEHVRNDKNPNRLSELARPPFEEKDLEALISKWNNSIFRNKTLNEWINLTQVKYKKLL